jgi:hypothetical protein
MAFPRFGSTFPFRPRPGGNNTSLICQINGEMRNKDIITDLYFIRQVKLSTSQPSGVT